MGSDPEHQDRPHRWLGSSPYTGASPRHDFNVNSTGLANLFESLAFVIPNDLGERGSVKIRQYIAERLAVGTTRSKLPWSSLKVRTLIEPYFSASEAMPRDGDAPRDGIG